MAMPAHCTYIHTLQWHGTVRQYSHSDTGMRYVTPQIHTCDPPHTSAPCMCGGRLDPCVCKVTVGGDCEATVACDSSCITPVGVPHRCVAFRHMYLSPLHTTAARTSAVSSRPARPAHPALAGRRATPAGSTVGYVNSSYRCRPLPWRVALLRLQLQHTELNCSQLRLTIPGSTDIIIQ